MTCMWINKKTTNHRLVAQSACLPADFLSYFPTRGKCKAKLELMRGEMISAVLF